MDLLPSDIVVLIALELPLPDLAKLKRVRRGWLGLLNSELFCCRYYHRYAPLCARFDIVAPHLTWHQACTRLKILSRAEEAVDVVARPYRDDRLRPSITFSESVGVEEDEFEIDIFPHPCDEERFVIRRVVDGGVEEMKLYLVRALRIVLYDLLLTGGRAIGLFTPLEIDGRELRCATVTFPDGPDHIYHL